MSHGDVIALQHDAGPASLVRCQSSPHSLWRQPVFALNLSQFEGPPPADPRLDVQASVEKGQGSWLEDAVCPVRVLYVGQNQTRLQGAQLAAGLPQPGLYSLQVGPGFNLADLWVKVQSSLVPNLLVFFQFIVGTVGSVSDLLLGP